MGLIKKFADYAGVKHEIDPTGHTHSTSESWLSTIVNNLTTLINGKAASVHTHTKSQITDFAHTHNANEVYWYTQVSPSGFYDLGVMMTSLTSKNAEQDEAIAGKASKNKIEDEEASLKIIDGYAILDGKKLAFELSDDGGGAEFEINVENSENLMRALENPDSTPTESSDNLITSGAVASALEEKADTSHTHTKSQITDFAHTHPQSEVTGLTAALSGKADKVSGATNGNLAALNSNGNLTDSGNKASDFTLTKTVIISNFGDTFDLDELNIPYNGLCIVNLRYFVENSPTSINNIFTSTAQYQISYLDDQTPSVNNWDMLWLIVQKQYSNSYMIKLITRSE